MKKFILFLFIVSAGVYLYGQTGEECISCSHNIINFPGYASGIGTGNQASGEQSFVGGYLSNAQGNYSMAYGYSAFSGGTNAISLGYQANATGMYSVAIGRQAYAQSPAAFALGLSANAQAESSYVFGEFLKATASRTITIGHGAGIGNNYLTNNIPKSMMIGIDSNVPTLFVSSSNGAGTTGRIGIGNITAPTAKLHIKADINEDAAIMLQPTGSAYTARIFFGDNNHSISAKTGENLVFRTGSGNHFVFNNGRVGIGTNAPTQTLDVQGTLRVSTLSSTTTKMIVTTSTGTLSTMNIPVGDNLGNHIATQNINMNGKYLSGDGTNKGVFVNTVGNVGIGTNTPGEKLEIAGTIKATTFSGDGSQLTNLTGDNLGNHIATQNINLNGKYLSGDGSSNGVFVSTGGDVGIGTNTPGQKLEVAGTIKATTFSGDGSLLTNLTGDNLGNHIMTQNLLTAGHWINGDNDNNEGIFVSNAGNLGIGTNSPDAHLQVNGGIYDIWARFKSGYSSLNIGHTISGAGLGVWGTTYIGFNLRREANNLWKTEYDGASNGGAMIYGTSGGDLVFTCVSNDTYFPEHQQLSDEQIKVNTKMILRSDGLLKVKEAVVKTDVWSDYVLHDDYPLLELSELAEFITKNHHLPDVPSEAQVMEEGINLGQMDAILLKKIEELTLYVIELKRENEEMRFEIENFKR